MPGARGSAFQFRVTDATPNSLAFVGLGLTPNNPPIPLNVVGWTNCIGFSVSLVVPTLATNATGAGSFSLVVPNDPSLDGAVVYGQWFQVDTDEPGNLTFSGYTRMTVGVDP